MKRFVRDEIRAFLKAVDKHAPQGITLVIIGGAAATLSFGAEGGTIDIDTATNVGALDTACEAAKKETGLAIPFGRASYFDAPYEYKSRLQRVVLRDIRKLKVLVPEKHDWALMKIVRFEDKDVKHLKSAAESVGFDKKILEERFLSEMTHVKPRARLIIHFLAMLEELYGEAEAARMQEVIKQHKNWR
jgi:hypothetical protein